MNELNDDLYKILQLSDIAAIMCNVSKTVYSRETSGNKSVMKDPSNTNQIFYMFNTDTSTSNQDIFGLTNCMCYFRASKKDRRGNCKLILPNGCSLT